MFTILLDASFVIIFILLHFTPAVRFYTVVFTLLFCNRCKKKQIATGATGATGADICNRCNRLQQVQSYNNIRAGRVQQGQAKKKPPAHGASKKALDFFYIIVNYQIAILRGASCFYNNQKIRKLKCLEIQKKSVWKNC